MFLFCRSRAFAMRAGDSLLFRAPAYFVFIHILTFSNSVFSNICKKQRYYFILLSQHFQKRTLQFYFVGSTFSKKNVHFPFHHYNILLSQGCFSNINIVLHPFQPSNTTFRSLQWHNPLFSAQVSFTITHI